MAATPRWRRLVGTRIFDHAPANVAFPYITFGRTSVYDWSTGTESGTEQLFTLHVWSKAKGKKEVLEIMELAARVCTMPRSISTATSSSTCGSNSPRHGTTTATRRIMGCCGFGR